MCYPDEIDDPRTCPPEPNELGECESCGSYLLQDDDHATLESYRCEWCGAVVCLDCMNDVDCRLCYEEDEE